VCCATLWVYGAVSKGFVNLGIGGGVFRLKPFDDANQESSAAAESQAAQ